MLDLAVENDGYKADRVVLFATLFEVVDEISSPCKEPLVHMTSYGNL